MREIIDQHLLFCSFWTVVRTSPADPSAIREGSHQRRLRVSLRRACSCRGGFPHLSIVGEAVSSAARSTCWRPHHHQPIYRYASSSSINAKRRCSNGLSGALLKVLHWWTYGLIGSPLKATQIWTNNFNKNVYPSSFYNLESFLVLLNCNSCFFLEIIFWRFLTWPRECIAHLQWETYTK